MADLENLDIKSIEQAVQNGSAVLIDVRSEDEWQEGRAKGALHFPVDQIGEEIHRLDKRKKVYVYCGSGKRAGIAERKLTEQGLIAQNIGGLSDWIKAGGKVEQ